MTDIVCISPIDGHEVARRPVATDAQIDATLKAARAAQREWAKVSIKDRCAFALKARHMQANIRIRVFLIIIPPPAGQR